MGTFPVNLGHVLARANDEERRVSAELLTVEKAAERLSLSRTKTYELISRGLLQSVKIDGSRRVPASALATFVAGLSPEGVNGDAATP